LINWLNGREPCGGGATLTRLATLIYESRPDLHAAFPSVSHGEVLGFLRWCLTAGAVELRLKREFLSPLRDSLREYTASVSLARRLSMILADRARYIVSATKALLSHRSINGLQPMRPSVGIENVPASAMTTVRVVHASAETDPGINIIGYVRSETGMGELSRSVIAAAGAAGVPVSICDFEVNNAARQEDFTVATMHNEIRYSVNVCAVNADQTSALIETLPRAAFTDRYNIGYWAWELEDFPDELLPAFERYDEIWTISSFCQDAISRKAPIPVLRMPLVVQRVEASGRGRECFNFLADEFLVLCIFDGRSVFRRKNPVGAVQAFRLALNRAPNSRLVLKVNNAEQFPTQMHELRTECAGLPVTIIDTVMTRSEVTDLIGCCDCVVSLHRSEGFGLVMAEAMQLGKPVVATAYSGNLDFTHPGTAFLVGGTMTEVGPDASPYSPSSRWVEPDIHAAADALISVRSDSQLRERVARQGQEYVRSKFSAAAVGKLIYDRLAVLRPRIKTRVPDA
jgi:hypothetical protein